ncbi:unnamed protein product, partial [Linum tenue]
VILYDLVCAGSVNPDYFDFHRYTTLEPYVDDLLNILYAHRIDRCAYVGHSVSAMIGLLASIRRPSSSPREVSVCGGFRFPNDKDYHGGYEQSEIEEVFKAMEANYEAWVQGFAPLALGADVPAAVREFTRTLFNMRPDITLFVSRQVEARRPIMAVDAVGIEDIEEVVDVRVEGGVAVEVKIFGVDAAGADEVVEDDGCHSQSTLKFILFIIF